MIILREREREREQLQLPRNLRLSPLIGRRCIVLMADVLCSWPNAPDKNCFDIKDFLIAGTFTSGNLSVHRIAHHSTTVWRILRFISVEPVSRNGLPVCRVRR